MSGWTGKLLRVNLSNGAVSEESIDPELAQAYLGARGLAARYLADEVEPDVDPFSPLNKLIFAAGVLTGTVAPCSGWFDIVTKSPLTGTIATSNSGGRFGPELKYAGYDMLIVEGKALTPVYLWILNNRVQIRDASELWGMRVPEATYSICGDTDEEAKVACIGPAGERRLPISVIVNDVHRAALRGGVGAVMGSKNLKAIAVLGNQPIKVAEPIPFKSAVLKARRVIAEHPVTGTGLRAYGSAALMNIMNEAGRLPARNFTDPSFNGAGKVGGGAIKQKLLVRSKGCHACTISCGRVTRVTNHRFAGFGEGPEFEAAWALGPNCAVEDLDAIAKANYLCNEYGLDVISVGGVISCAMEMHEKGYIEPGPASGLPLVFGNAEAMVDMVRKIGEGSGFGEELGQGAHRFAQSYRHPELAMTVKNQEIACYDPRGIQGIGLSMATSNKGGCHNQGFTVFNEVLGSSELIDPNTTEGKADLTKYFQDLTAALDSVGACLFTLYGLGAEELSEMTSRLTGVRYSVEDFLRAGERVWNLERLWNVQAGFTAADDTLPERMLHEPLRTGPARGQVNRLGDMLPEYYELRGWTTEGVPSEQKLAELRLEVPAGWRSKAPTT